MRLIHYLSDEQQGKRAKLFFSGVQSSLAKATMLFVIFGGAIGPIFRSDTTAKYISGICIVVLTALAAKAMRWRYRRGEFGKQEFQNQEFRGHNTN